VDLSRFCLACAGVFIPKKFGEWGPLRNQRLFPFGPGFAIPGCVNIFGPMPQKPIELPPAVARRFVEVTCLFRRAEQH
jgi:hypothetical protein